MTLELHCDDGKWAVASVPGTPEEIRTMYIESKPAPLRELIRRHFDTDGDGKFNDVEWQACEAFEQHLTETFHNSLSLISDKDATQAEREKAFVTLHEGLDLAMKQRADRDGPPSEDDDALQSKYEDGEARYILRVEKQALAANGGKPGEAVRAALLKAIEADIRERAKKFGMNNSGELTSEGCAKLFMEMTDEFLKEE